ncbi:MAG: hypothetical protein AAB468_02425 [Patescibacteria group bacterium]
MTQKKSITLDDLARMMQEQFSANESKMDTMSRILRAHTDQFEHIRDDIRDIKTTLGPLVGMFALQERKVEDLESRLEAVERKVGIGE